METIVITGANRGIGLALAKLYVAADNRVIAGCRNPDAAEELKSLAPSDRLTLLPLDVSSESSVSAFTAEIPDEKIDVLINNAGVMGGSRQSVNDMDYSAWLNSKGSFAYRSSKAAVNKVMQVLMRWSWKRTGSSAARFTRDGCERTWGVRLRISLSKRVPTGWLRSSVD